MEICFVSASVAAPTMGGMTVMVLKQMVARWKKVMEPLGDDDGLVGVQISEGRAVCCPVDVGPDGVWPSKPALKMAA